MGNKSSTPTPPYLELEQHQIAILEEYCNAIGKGHHFNNIVITFEVSKKQKKTLGQSKVFHSKFVVNNSTAGEVPFSLLFDDNTGRIEAIPFLLVF